MARKAVPNAWDDEWEAQADKAAQAEEQPTLQEGPAVLSRSDRLAQHKESNKKLWQSAETPEEFHFLAASSDPPLATGFKPAMKVLSRRPAPKMISKRDPVTGLEKLILVDDDNEDDASKQKQPTVEEIRRRQQKDLEEKQRRYEEARAKIFGESKSTPSSGQSTPGNITPPQTSEGRQSQNQRGGRGRGRGGYRVDNIRHDNPTRRPVSNTGTRELFDPNFSPKPGFTGQKRGAAGGSPQSTRSNTPREEDQVIRAPKGPDGSGRGGFGFARRGAKES